MGTIDRFERDRYLILREVVDVQVREVFRHYVRDQITQGAFAFESDGSKRWSRYKDPLSEALLRTLQPVFETATGLRLLPSYSFTALYPPGAYLDAHSDRHSCEVSASVTLDMRERDLPTSPWGLWFEVDGRPTELLLEPGDLVVYRGIELRHWREELGPRRWNTSVFLHYVDADGPHAALAGDAGSAERPPA